MRTIAKNRVSKFFALVSFGGGGVVVMVVLDR